MLEPAGGLRLTDVAVRDPFGVTLIADASLAAAPGRLVHVVGETSVGGRTAILPTIEGRAFITGTMSYFLDPADPWPEGYRVADTWGVLGKTGMTQGEE